MNCKWNCMKSRVQRHQSTIQEAPLQIRLASLVMFGCHFSPKAFTNIPGHFSFSKRQLAMIPTSRQDDIFDLFGVPEIAKITRYRCLVDSFPFSKKDFLRKKKQFSQIAASEIFLGQHLPTMPFLNYHKTSKPKNGEGMDFPQRLHGIHLLGELLKNGPWIPTGGWLAWYLPECLGFQGALVTED